MNNTQLVLWSIGMLFSGFGLLVLKQQWGKKKRQKEEKRNAERESRETFRKADRIIHEKKQRPQTSKTPILMQCDFELPVRNDVDDIMAYIEETVELARQLKGQKTSSKLFTVVEADLVDGALNITEEIDENTGKSVTTQRKLLFRMNYTIK